jgi:hypothetical protein
VTDDSAFKKQVRARMAFPVKSTFGWQVSDVNFLGGNTPDLDLIATSPDDTVVVEFQVRQTRLAARSTGPSQDAKMSTRG